MLYQYLGILEVKLTCMGATDRQQEKHHWVSEDVWGGGWKSNERGPTQMVDVIVSRAQLIMRSSSVGSSSEEFS